MERWRAIPGFEGMYEVSDHGIVRSVDRSTTRMQNGIKIVQPLKGRIMGVTITKDGGYHAVTLCKNGSGRPYTVHTLVAAAFLGERPEGCIHVCHGDGVPTHNHYLNLRYDTPVGNAADRHLHDTHAKGESNPMAVLNVGAVIDVKQRLQAFTIKDVSEMTGWNYSTVRDISQGRNWGDVEVALLPPPQLTQYLFDQINL